MVSILTLALLLVVVVLLKGEVWTGLLGVLIAVLLLIGAIRLSRPHAPWRLHYPAGQDAVLTVAGT